MKSRQRGQQTVEFAGALAVLILCVALPMLDLCIIPIRSGLAASIVNNYAKQLSLAEKYSQAKTQLDDPEVLFKRLKAVGGVNPQKSELSLIVESSREIGNQTKVVAPGGIPANWQPDGTSCPCTYTLNLKVAAEVSPLILVPLVGAKVPGLSVPISTTYSANAPFENLGRDPITQEYFVNE